MSRTFGGRCGVVSVLRVVARRVLLSAVVVWLTVTIMFLFVTFAPNVDLTGKLGTAAFAGANESELELIRQQYVSRRGLDQPLWRRYLDWCWALVSGNWGSSWDLREPVLPLIARRVARTLMYVVPGVLLAAVGGLAVGALSAFREGSPLERVGRVGSYFLLGLPNFYLLGLAAVAASPPGFSGPTGTTATLLYWVLPPLVVATGLLAAIGSYARAEAKEHVNSAFVAFHRAKGAGELSVVTHVMRVALVPMIALVFTEAFAVLLLETFVVEAILPIRGFGSLLLFAINSRDIPVVLGATMVIVFGGIVVNAIQDLSALTLDPRIGE